MYDQWHEVLIEKAPESFHCGISKGAIKHLEALRAHHQIPERLVTSIQTQVEKNIIRNISSSSFHKSNHFLELKRRAS